MVELFYTLLIKSEVKYKVVLLFVLEFVCESGCRTYLVYLVVWTLAPITCGPVLAALFLQLMVLWIQTVAFEERLESLK